MTRPKALPKHIAEKDILRYWSKVNKGDESQCWVWTGYRNSKGYGRFSIGRTFFTASRIAWLLKHGELNPEKLVCHNCPGGDNPRCVNPAHLFLGTSLDNHRDSKNKGRRATGKRHGAHTKPERRASGDRHWTRTSPEKLKRGDSSPSRLHPERVARGERANKSKLTEADVVSMRTDFVKGTVSMKQLANQHRITVQAVWSILHRRSWKHV